MVTRVSSILAFVFPYKSNNPGRNMGKSREYRDAQRTSSARRQRHAELQFLQLANMVHQHGRSRKNYQRS